MVEAKYKLKFTSVSLKDIKNFDNTTQIRIIDELNKLLKSPYNINKDIKKLKGINKKIYRLKLGDLRIIYFLSDTELVVLRIIDRKDLMKIIDSIKRS
ncbi:MAG: type II toxin-antitoxin system RelE/ParE family toxin [Actinobacteria bacterium]|nr:type II toxin-antitoxin system RelE/ParE family toxin [Actinomycetota bacterium]